MRRPNRRTLAVLAAGMALGIVVHLVQIQRACADPASEACVWGRAYLPVSLVLAGVYGLAFSAFGYVLMRAFRRGRATNQHGAADEDR